MTSLFFYRMLHLMEGIIEKGKAHSIIERYCKDIGTNPEDISSEHGGLLAMKLMSDLSDLLPREKWVELDERFKKFLSDSTMSKSKVKGIVLGGTQDYVSLKKGKITLDQIRKMTNLPPRLRDESWYPIEVLEDFLITTHQVTKQRTTSRSRAIGRHIVSPKVLRSAPYLFGMQQRSTYKAFTNLSEILILDNFSVGKQEDFLLIRFEGEVSEHFKEFLLGICDAIFEMRNIVPRSMEFSSGGNGSIKTFLKIRFQEKEGVS